ncbi:MAG TPA: glycosyltransferase family 2 protein [Armatimonadota bacterium]|jgi:glycosyltransferase involved in cell wall biosynthesis
MSTRPLVSVIIPVRNEGRYIGACLESLLRCSYPPTRWEIILADGMSDDATRSEVARVARRSPVSIIVVDNPRRVTPFALNLALGLARGEIIIRIDAHAEYGDDYVTRCVAASQARDAANVGGVTVAIPGAPTPMGRAIALAMMHPFGVGNAMMRISRTAQEVDTVPFGCFRAEVFTRIGLFDERLVRNQDYELNQRIRRSGGRVFLDPSLELRYISRPTLRKLLQQAWANGFWNALCHHVHPYSRSLRHVIPLGFSVGAVWSVAAAVWAWWGGVPAWAQPLAWCGWAIYLAYLAMDLVVTTRLAAKHGWRLWPALVILFPAFHFANGAGLALGWTRALLHRYPWQPEDHIPTWDEQRLQQRTRMAA